MTKPLDQTTITADAYQRMINDKRNKRRSRPSHPESRLQCACVQWFRLQHSDKRLLLFAVPNGGFRIASEAVRLYGEGVVSGVSDLIYLEARGGYGALCIEMKTAKAGSRQSDRQREWQAAAEAAGNRYVVCRSLDDFRREVEAYLALDPEFSAPPPPDVDF